ncbi:MAG: (Fe-S)-binding protein [Chloroflexi bacterium]|nr:(Fe-S)-binding protein [Chloroflexota bacterium]
MTTQPAGKKDVSFVDNLTRLQVISLDACTRCMQCLEWCPVLDATEDESLTTPEKIRTYGEIVRSQHGLRARLFGRPEVSPEVLEKLTQALFTCTTCGRCGEVCSVGINTQRLWPAIRAKMVELGIGPVGAQREIPSIVAQKHNPYDGDHAERFAWIPPEVPVAGRAEIGYFAGCSGAYTARPMLVGAVTVLHALGIEFTLFKDEWCCGFPLFIVGELSPMEQMIRHNVDGFAAQGVKHLVVSCPCCMFMLQNHWPYFYGEPLPFDIIHTTQFIKPHIEAGKLKLSKSLDATITYHDPCYLSRGTHVIDEPREVLAQIRGARVVEMRHSRELSRCCGAGGGIRRGFPEVSIQMARALLREAEDVGADILAIDCPACYERLHLAQQGFSSSIQVLDLMQLVADLL